MKHHEYLSIFNYNILNIYFIHYSNRRYKATQTKQKIISETMSEFDDTDSFNDLNDDESIFQDDPYQHARERNPEFTMSSMNNNGLIDRVRTWWNGRALSQSRLYKLNDRGIPLYDLDTDGRHSRLREDEHSFEPVPYPPSYFITSQYSSKYTLLFKVLKWVVIFGFIIALVLHIVLTTKNHKSYNDDDVSNIFIKLNKDGFHRNTLYNNGTHDFYPITLIINLRYMSPQLISHEQTPFLYSMIYPSPHIDMNDTLVSVLEPNFPFESKVQDWSMVTGQFPMHNGVISDQIDTLNNTNVSIPIWDKINASYSGNYSMKLYG